MTVKRDVEVTEFTSTQKREEGEHMLAWFLIAPHPVMGFRLHLRTNRVAVEHLRKDERGRKAVFECIDQLMDEFKRLVERGV